MRVRFMKVLAVTIAMLLGNTAFAQEDILIDTQRFPASCLGVESAWD
jgi:hypothetical protein